MATITEIPVHRGRGSELSLLLIGSVIVVSAMAFVEANAGTGLTTGFWISTLVIFAVAVSLNILTRIFAKYADPVLLPAVFTLTGIGLAMLRRIDYSYAARGIDKNVGGAQTLWAVIGILGAIMVLLIVRDHRKLRRYTYTIGLLGLVLLLLPLVPGLGIELNGARIWISLFGHSMQPGEFAKIALVIFFAGYLATNRDSLALAGPKVLGVRTPRPRDLGPLLVVWVIAILILVYQRDLGASLLIFGIFLAMIYVATQRVSWVLIGLVLFLLAAIVAGIVFPHVALRYEIWLNALDPELYASGKSEQLVRGLFGFAAGGLFGTGLGEGHPNLVPIVESDFIFSAIGEELGLTGLMAILALYLIAAQRAFRTAIGVRDGFGKLISVGLGFTLVLQLFVVLGGITRVIPLTGLTAPFIAYGGSSLLANWLIVGLLLRISDNARKPASPR